MFMGYHTNSKMLGDLGKQLQENWQDLSLSSGRFSAAPPC